jgi:hypothetical protein
MENFKIEHFKKDNPSKEFPWFKALSSDEARVVYEEISRKIGKNIDPDQLVIKIDEAGKPIKSFNANNEDFVLNKVFETLNISPTENVFINWYRFDNIDEICLEDLNLHFDDVWYPGSDDIDIFDANFSLILSVSHGGAIKILRI